MSTPQYDQARALANAVRKTRSRLRFEIAGLDPEQGRGVIADLISDGFDTHDEIRTAIKNARMFDVLKWGRRMQSEVASRYMAAVGAADVRLVGELTERQRHLLADLLRGGVDRLRVVEEENEFEKWRRIHGQQDAA